MGATHTCVELCHLKDYLPFIIFLLLSITGILLPLFNSTPSTSPVGSLGSRSLVKEQTSNREINIAKLVISKDFVNRTNSSLLTHKLPPPLATPTGYGPDIDRFGFGPACYERDADINQMPNPTVPIEYSYLTVVVSNTCTSDSCRIGNIHVSCGGFSFDKGPTVFRRLSDDDCLVNNGDPLGQSEVLIFEYSHVSFLCFLRCLLIVSEIYVLDHLP